MLTNLNVDKKVVINIEMRDPKLEIPYAKEHPEWNDKLESYKQIHHKDFANIEAKLSDYLVRIEEVKAQVDHYYDNRPHYGHAGDPSRDTKQSDYSDILKRGWRMHSVDPKDKPGTAAIFTDDLKAAVEAAKQDIELNKPHGEPELLIGPDNWVEDNKKLLIPEETQQLNWAKGQKGLKEILLQEFQFDVPPPKQGQGKERYKKRQKFQVYNRWLAHHINQLGDLKEVERVIGDHPVQDKSLIGFAKTKSVRRKKRKSHKEELYYVYSNRRY